MAKLLYAEGKIVGPGMGGEASAGIINEADGIISIPSASIFQLLRGNCLIA